jgi:hypothetical protein
MKADLKTRAKILAARFRDQQLEIIRAVLYAGATAEFQADHSIIIQAITAPAAFLHARDLRLSGARYGQILRQVLDDIRTHGNLAGIRSRAAYLLHCVQKHMECNADRYLDEAKNVATGRPVAQVVAAVVRGTAPVTDSELDAALSTAIHEAARVLVQPRRTTHATPQQAR